MEFDPLVVSHLLYSIFASSDLQTFEPKSLSESCIHVLYHPPVIRISKKLILIYSFLELIHHSIESTCELS